MTSSQGVNRCLARRDIRCPMLNSTSILGLHPIKTLYLGISPCHMHLPQVPLVGKCPRSIPWQDSSQDSSYVLLDRLDPHHTPKTRAKISLSSLPSYYQVIGTTCLIHSCHSFTKHHIIDIMHSKSKAVSRMRAFSLTAGVQGNRLRQDNGLQAILPCNLS
jgi:hypothetical protein